jgi:tetratricopeptide (TPR) repeat protein
LLIVRNSRICFYSVAKQKNHQQYIRSGCSQQILFMQENKENQNTGEISGVRNLFFGCLSVHLDADGKPVYHFVWKRFSTILLCTFLFLWFSESISIFCFYRYFRDFKEMSVLDAITFPFSQKSINREFGNLQIAQAKDAIKQGKYQNAYLLMKTGLGRAPENLEGRLALADFLRAIHQDDQAITILEGGLVYHQGSPLFMKAYLQTLVSCNHDSVVIDYAKQRLEACGDHPTDSDRMIAYVAAQVGELNGQFGLALDSLAKYKLDGTVEGCMLKAKCFWDAENHQGAISVLRSFMLMHPQVSSVDMGSLLCSYLNEDKNYSESMLTALGLCNSNPKSDDAHRQLIICCDKMGQKDRAAKEKKNYIDKFDDNPDALLKIADYAIGNGDLDLANEVYSRAGEKGYQFGIFGMLMIEAHLSSGDYENAEKYCDQILGENPSWIKRYENQFYFLKAAASRKMGKNQVANLYFDKIHNSTAIMKHELLAMAKRLYALNLDDDALSIYEQAKVIDAHDSDIISGIVKIDLRNNYDSNFLENVDTLLSLRREGYDLLRSARQRLTSDHFVFDTGREAVIVRLDKVLEEPGQIAGR